MPVDADDVEVVFVLRANDGQDVPELRDAGDADRTGQR